MEEIQIGGLLGLLKGDFLVYLDNNGKYYLTEVKEVMEDGSLITTSGMVTNEDIKLVFSKGTNLIEAVSPLDTIEVYADGMFIVLGKTHDRAMRLKSLIDGGARITNINN